MGSEKKGGLKSSTARCRVVLAGSSPKGPLPNVRRFSSHLLSFVLRVSPSLRLSRGRCWSFLLWVATHCVGQLFSPTIADAKPEGAGADGACERGYAWMWDTRGALLSLAPCCFGAFFFVLRRNPFNDHTHTKPPIAPI